MIRIGTEIHVCSEKDLRMFQGNLILPLITPEALFNVCFKISSAVDCHAALSFLNHDHSDMSFAFSCK